MEILTDYFDDFNLHARVMPVIVASIPLWAFALYKGITMKSLESTLLYSIFIISAIYIISKLGRQAGKHLEQKMFPNKRKLPSTIILRFSDDTIDKITKLRYHKKLNEKIQGLNLPLTLADEERDNESDEKYITAGNWLRKYANSNKDKEQRVYQELKDYNFWRNLLGIKKYCILLYSLIAMWEAFSIDKFSLTKLITKPYPEYIAFLIMVILELAMVVVVNKKTVLDKSYDYAKALIEVCDNL